MSHGKPTFVFNFQKQFAADVKSGKKRQTIRAERKDLRRPVVGGPVKLYTGLRTKQTELLAEGVVLEVFSLVMDTTQRGVVFVPGDGLMSGPALEQLATRDGFENAAAMFSWFAENHGEKFEGFCTRW